MFMNDTELIDYFSQTRQLQPNTRKSYTIFIRQYSNLQGMPMVELLKEAEAEEEQGIRWKHRRLRQRLMDYRAFLYDKYAYSTAKSRFSKLLSFYKHFEIEIHPLPSISQINVSKTHMGFKDLPDKKLLSQCLKISNNLMKAIILFMSSSGTARMETCNLTIQDFIDATNNQFIQYHNSNDIYEVINVLKDRTDIVPVFHMNRQKTNKYYYTFCSPEATSEIIGYLASSNRKLHSEDKLFQISTYTFTDSFRDINDRLGLGYLDNGRRRFTSHMLRKFHSSSLYNDGVSLDVIDNLQGRGKDLIHSSYFFENPLKLRELYISHLPCLLVDYNVNQLDVKSPEFLSLEAENKELKQLNDDVNERLENLERIVLEGVSKDDLRKLDKLL